MSNYTLSTDFTAKDSLISGNPAKLVKGSEISTEFNSVATAIASKVDKTSATGSAQIPAGTQAQRDGSPAAGYVRFNSSSGAFEGFDGTQWGPLGSNNGPVADVLTYTATASQTVFTLSMAYTPGQHQIEVFVNGLLMSLTTDYVETDYQTITFNSGLTVGDEVVFRIWRTDTLTDGDASNISYLPAGTSAVTTNVQTKLRESVSVKDFGAVGDGVTDDTAAIQAAVSAHAHVHITGGNYLYTAATTADPAKISLAPDAEIKGMATDVINIGVRDKARNFIGFQHNYNEITATASPITQGSFISPPLSDASSTVGVDVLAHFYNDFGLEAVRAAGGSLGSTQWYTWEWNHTTNNTYGAYDPQRHPLLGWYRGDDPVALDWICYWLREAGVSGVVLPLGKVDTATWTSNTERYYWLYQLFNNVPNFKGLKYVLGGPASGTQADYEAHWDDMKADVLVDRNYYVTNINGKRYGTIFLYDMGTERTGVFGGSAAYETWLKSMATYFQGHGLDGLCVLGRNSSYYTANSVSTIKNTKAVLNDFGVYVFAADYGVFSGTGYSATTYGDLVNQFNAAYAADSFRHIPNVMTARSSKYHPSGWTNTGSTPALFAKALQYAANAAVGNETIPNIITVYNVSEWGEGGAALQPNMQDGFGYLDAVRKIGSSGNGKNYDILPDTYSGTTASKVGSASDAVAFTAATFTVTSSNSVSLCEVEIAAKENTGNYASVTRKYVFSLTNTSGTLVASAVNTDAAYTTDRSNANYSIAPTVAVAISSATSANCNITLTKGGTIGWSVCEYVVRARIISCDPASVS